MSGRDAKPPDCTCPKDPFGQTLWFEYWDGTNRAEKLVDEHCPVHGYWALDSGGGWPYRGDQP